MKVKDRLVSFEVDGRTVHTIHGHGVRPATDLEVTLFKERDELLDAVTRCYKMLLSEPDTQGALFKAENILREAIADATGAV